MGKKLDETLKFLGSQYLTKVIDLEPCIWRKISSNYDIEISGLNNKSSKFLVTVYVWEISPTTQIVETISNITSKEMLKTILDSLLEKYSN